MNRQMNRRRMHRGFTLMEVLLVLAILVILFSTAVGIYTGVQANADINAAKVQVGAINNAIDTYRATAREYPSTLEDLSVMPAHLSTSKWAGPYMEDIPNDPWGNQYQYAYPGTQNSHLDKPDIWSWGPDKQSGTEDDIGNWRTAEQ
jgi:general secretion pathway protein G